MTEKNHRKVRESRRCLSTLVTTRNKRKTTVHFAPRSVVIKAFKYFGAQKNRNHFHILRFSDAYCITDNLELTAHGFGVFYLIPNDFGNSPQQKSCDKNYSPVNYIGRFARFEFEYSPCFTVSNFPVHGFQKQSTAIRRRNRLRLVPLGTGSATETVRRRKWSDWTAVSFGMQREMIGTSEGPAANVTLKRAIAGVFTKMSCEFVGPREAPPAVGPFTRVRLFTCNIAHNAFTYIM